MLRNILLGAGVFAALFAILIFSGKLPIGQGNAKAKGEVALWGTIPEQQMNRVVQEFNPKAESYRVTYREIPEAQFSQTLLEALANGTAPDLIIAPHQILLANQARLYPFPIASLSEKTFKDTYVDGASILFTSSGALALPVSIDPLVLFYNRSLLSKHGIANPPTYWDEVATLAPLLTLRDAKGSFLESAIALGAPNVSYIKDILMAVVEELGQAPVLFQVRSDGVPIINVTANTPTATAKDVFPLATAVMFFTQFADPTKSAYTWNQYASSPDQAFVAEKLAMYIGRASELSTLRARNPNGDFEMTYLPQTRGYNTFITDGQMYGIATLKTTKNALTSFTVESQFAGAGISPAIASAIGATPALRAYSATTGLPDVIARSMLVAKPWYDTFPAQSAGLVVTMLTDVLSGRLGPADAAGAFVTRLQDLYTPI